MMVITETVKKWPPLCHTYAYVSEGFPDTASDVNSNPLPVAS